MTFSSPGREVLPETSVTSWIDSAVAAEESAARPATPHQMIPLSQIRTDGGTQMRAELSQEVYLDYRDKWLAGVEFEPIILFFDGVWYWLADGFHRFYGRREARMETIPAIVHQGTCRDAILYATGANADHGLRRTNADKRRSVLALLNDPEWCLWSDREIAARAGVGNKFVGDIRRELCSEHSSSPAAVSAEKPRVGRDGKSRKPPRKPAQPSSPAPAMHSREPGDESEPEGEAPIEPTAEQVDAIIASLPLDPEDAYEATQHVDELLKAISRVKQLMEKVGNGPAGRLLDADAERQSLTKMYERVKSARPYAVCPKPVNAGDHSGCKVCHGAGFITKGTKVPGSFQSLALHKFEEMEFPKPHSPHVPPDYSCLDDKEFNEKGFRYLRWLTDQPRKYGISHRAPEAQRLRELWEINCQSQDAFMKLVSRVQAGRATAEKSQAA